MVLGPHGPGRVGRRRFIFSIASHLRVARGRSGAVSVLTAFVGGGWPRLHVAAGARRSRLLGRFSAVGQALVAGRGREGCSRSYTWLRVEGRDAVGPAG